MVLSPSKRKGRVSPHLLEYVFSDPVAEAEAEASAKPEATTSKHKKLRTRNSVEWADQLEKTTQEAEAKEEPLEEKEVFVVRDPAEGNRRWGRGRGRPRGSRGGSARGRGGTVDGIQESKVPASDDRLPYGFPAEGEAKRQISEQSDLRLHDQEKKADSPEAEKVRDSMTCGKSNHEKAFLP
ncbi:hypothetical protein F4805DRAFT_452973 [Annulohypoxylon moriforme]|nr:hypothetical protein F4805DRAFT_452973 [Annulohypoxylon moriforme]